jgi:AraC family transcriptional regulator
MTPKSVLPVPGVEVLSDGRFIRPIPAVSSLTSEHAKWDGIALESYCNVPGCDIAEHEHPTHLLNLLVGEPVRTEWTTEGRCHSAINEPGTIYLLPRGTRDKVTWMHQSSRVMLAIDPNFLAQSVEETAHLEDVALTPDWELKDRHIAALMMALHADLEDGQPAGPLYGEMLAATLAAYLVKRFSIRPVAAKRAAGGLPKARLRRVFEFISAHLGDEIRLETLASIAGMSQHHFSELFRRSTGVTPHQYVIGQRVERGKRMLRDTDLSILEIGLATGFADQSHFTKTFRRVTRVTPRDYRVAA